MMSFHFACREPALWGASMTMWEFLSKDNRRIVVRRAVVSDARDIHDGFCRVVDEGVWLPTYRANTVVADWVAWINRCGRTRDALLVAELDGKYAGHLTLQPEEWAASTHVTKLGIIVIRESRALGVGRALMTAAENEAKALGYIKIVLSTFDDNAAARSLYDSCGYVVVGRRKNHFRMPKGYIDEILYEKELTTVRNSEAKSRVA